MCILARKSEAAVVKMSKHQILRKFSTQKQQQNVFQFINLISDPST